MESPQKEAYSDPTGKRGREVIAGTGRYIQTAMDEKSVCVAHSVTITYLQTNTEVYAEISYSQGD